MVAVCNGTLLAAGEGLAEVRVTLRVDVAGGRVGVPVDVGTGDGVNDGKSGKAELGVIVAITICVGKLEEEKGLSE